jgi:hypothetical protein
LLLFYIYVEVVPFSALTVTVTVFSPSFKSLLPLTLYVAFELFGVTATLTSVISFVTLNVYSFTFELNSGVIVPCAIANAFNFESLDFVVTTGVVGVVGVVVGAFDSNYCCY